MAFDENKWPERTFDMKKTAKAKKTAKGAATVADYSYAKETDIKRPTLPTGEYSGIAAERR